MMDQTAESHMMPLLIIPLLLDPNNHILQVRVRCLDIYLEF